MSKGEIVKGRRLPDGERSFAPGDYGKIDGVWMARAPRGHMGNLSAHEVTEHEDGTITVFPSIMLTGGGETDSWHGFLERGIWREA